MDSLGKVTAQDLVDAVRPCLPLPHLDVVQIHGGAFWLRKKMDGDNWRNEALMIESGEQRIIGAIWQACAERGWAVFLDRIMNRSCVAGSDAPGTDAIALCRAYAAACEAGKGQPMGKPINENPNPAPRMNAPVVQLNPSSEVAALRARAEKAEAEAAEWKAASAINGSNMAGYQTRSIVAEERLVKAKARAERLAAECRLWREWAGDVLTGWPCVNGQPITAAVDAHRDLEGGAA